MPMLNLVQSLIHMPGDVVSFVDKMPFKATTNCFGDWAASPGSCIRMIYQRRVTSRLTKLGHISPANMSAPVSDNGEENAVYSLTLQADEVSLRHTIEGLTQGLLEVIST